MISKSVPFEEQQSFIQNWLYFGLIAELLGANCADSQDGSSPMGCQGRKERERLYSIRLD
jgi:hypothetical protein